MRILTPKELTEIDAMVAGLRSAYNSFDVEACDFAGAPGDFASLDFIPYELPMPEQFADGSLAFALTWGNVLAKSFGFTWVADDHCQTPESFALRHDDPKALVFPYFRLREITESSGSADTPAQTLWFDIVRYHEARTYVADGWHPVFDAAQCPEKLGCPSSTTDACTRLIDSVPDFMLRMSTYPYDYAKSANWTELTAYAVTILDAYHSTDT